MFFRKRKSAFDRAADQHGQNYDDAAGMRMMAWFVVVAIIAVCLALIGSAVTADASPRRLAYIERVQGLHEVKNRKTIQAMVGVNPRRVPWCGAAIAYSVRKDGGRPPRDYLRAASWKRFGKPVSARAARPGDVVIIKTRRGYHVTLFGGWRSGGKFRGCGGNQSNRFKCSTYRVRSIVAVRR